MKHGFALALPANFRVDDVLKFHSRDAESVAEEVSDKRIRKGMLLDGVPLVLRFRRREPKDRARDQRGRRERTRQ